MLSTTSNDSTTTKVSEVLHYEQQRAVGYPTFPGNIEALSLPAYSPERHASQDSVSSTTTTTTTSTIVSPPPLSSMSSTSSTSSTLTSNQSNQSPKAKRRQTLAACRPCRKRKSKVRPFLTAYTGCSTSLNTNETLSVTARVLGVTPASTKQHLASSRSKKARPNNKLLAKNSKHTDPLCACCEEPHPQLQKLYSGTSDNTTM